MKKLILITWALGMTLYGMAIRPAPGSGSVRWHRFDAGLQIATAQKKPIVIDFFSVNCGWCKVMERETFSNAAVLGKLSGHYVPIRIDMDRNESFTFNGRTVSAREFAMMLGVQGLPTIVFMDKNGKFITKIPGYIKTDVFLPLLDYVRMECYNLQVSFQDFRDGKGGCK